MTLGASSASKSRDANPQIPHTSWSLRHPVVGAPATLSIEQMPPQGSARPPKVLHLIGSMELGGTEKQLVEYLNRSSDIHHEVALFYGGGPLQADLPRRPHVIGPTRPGRLGTYVGTAAAVARLRRLSKQLAVDIIHAHLGHAELVAALATPAEVSLIASRRGRNVGFEDHKLLKLLEALAHKRVDLMVCNSQYLRAHTIAHDRHVPPIHVVYNGIDSASYAQVGDPTATRPTVGMIANMIWYKRHDLFLRAWRQVVDQKPDAIALLAGDGPGRRDVEDQIARLGLGQNVELLGRIEDVRPVYAASHLITLTSLHEGFPNALLEGMASGRPVVATATGGIPELVRHGVEGYLTSEDERSLAQSYLALFADPQIRERMGDAARSRAATFSWARVVAEMNRIYSAISSGDDDGLRRPM